MKFGLKVTIPWTAPIIFSLLLVIGYGSLYYGPQKSLNFDQLFMAKFTFYLVDFLLLAFSTQKALRNYVVVAFILTGQHRINNEFLDFF